jgi:type I restriction enzyme M protein
MNEKKTEEIVRKHLKKQGFYDDQNITIEYEKSDNPRINNLLKSKSGNGKPGRVEFIITFKDDPENIIIIECKADVRKHESDDRSNYGEFATDGALWYASYLSKEFNVIAIAVSGQTEEEIKVSNFLWIKKNTGYKELKRKKIEELKEYIFLFRNDEEVLKKKEKELVKFSRDLHNYMRDYAKLTEEQKPLLVSALLIALDDETFKKIYNSASNSKILSGWIIDGIERNLESAEIPEAKKKNLIQVYSFIPAHPELSKGNVLMEITKQIDENVLPFMKENNNIDVVGQFYGEFLRYTGGDGKGLGIVLTPRHITELFSDLANLTPESVVLDTCTGTGGFLISAMHHMIEKAEGDEEKIERIKKNNLIGVEQQPNMFALAASNMILRGDGKSNLYMGSCFDFKEELLRRKPTVGMINPPYSQKGSGLSELHFIDYMLDCLEPNGIGIAIVPMSCAIDTRNPLREKMLEKHTLDAVINMPPKLFEPGVSTHTCIMIFKAKVPHNKYYESWFASWEDDGFELTKGGRIDAKHKWEQIRENWLDMYFNRRVIKGHSVRQKINAEMEWCYQAYVETDYSTVTEKDFERELKKYVIFKMMNEGVIGDGEGE